MAEKILEIKHLKKSYGQNEVAGLSSFLLGLIGSFFLIIQHSTGKTCC